MGHVPALSDLEIQRRLATEGEASVGSITLRVRATFYLDPAAPETIVPTL